MEQIKIFGTLLVIIAIVLSCVIGLTMFGVYVSEKGEDSRLARQIQCKEVGGVVTYENYNWVCK